MDADKNSSVGEEWIKKKLNITHENLGNCIHSDFKSFLTKQLIISFNLKMT